MVAKPLNKIIQNQAYQIVFYQLIGIVILAVLAIAVSGVANGLALFAGGMAYGLPNLFFVWRVFRFAGAHQMTQFMASFFIGELLKLILSAMLFLMIVKTLPVSLLSMLIGFIGAIVSFWIACVGYFYKRKGSAGTAMRLLNE